MTPSLPTSGVFPALWTPTDADGRVLESALREHAAWLRDAGVHGLMVLGSTGEFPLFSVDERETFLRRIAEWVAPLPVLANISDIRPRVVARLARAARESGCAAVAVLPPWYYALSQPDLLEFFLRAAEAAAPLPVFLYNFPERVGIPIEPETMASFADRAPLAGVKLSGGSWDLHTTVVALAKARGFRVLTGWDTRLAEAMALGCTGCISGLANFAVEPLVATFRAVQSGDRTSAEASTGRLRDLADAVRNLSFPHDVAAGMAARGFTVGEPKQVVSETTRRARDAASMRLRERLMAMGLR